MTTLISEGVPKPALVPWAVKETATYAVNHIDALKGLATADAAGAIEYLKGQYRSRTRAAAHRGTEVHRIADACQLGEDPGEIPEGIEPYVAQYRRFLDEHAPRFIASEAAVYNPRQHYAGTLDAIAEIDGRIVALDMKTTPKGPDASSRPPYPEVALQLAAYANAELIGLDDGVRMTGRGWRRYYTLGPETLTAPMPKVDGAFALVVSPFDYQLVPVRIDEEVFAAFRFVREVARWQLQTSQSVFGPPVTATTAGALQVAAA
ncbi:MAG: hypothetical protein FJX57_24040 [Alphaproteobacteria bacterium]|nr:hypothetical protein [Alphaproteobacteria bacterium]